MSINEMKQTAIIILLLSALGCCKSQSGYLGRVTINHPPLIIFWGESNASGKALNSAATSAELSERARLKIFNNTQTETFQNLHIPLNNNLGHSGIDSTLYHGWELELANLGDSGTLNSPIYVCKNGQGGSDIESWVNPAFLNCQNRWVWPDSAKKLLTTINNGVAPTMYIFYSQGINDIIEGTSAATWKTKTETLFDSIRVRYGTTPIFMTYFVGSYTAYNSTIDQICIDKPDVYAIQTSDASGDGTHWDYNGMKLIGRRMVTTLKAHYTY